MRIFGRNKAKTYMVMDVRLKTGELLKGIRFPLDVRFDHTDLTEKTIHKFVNVQGTTGYFVQGDNISYIETHG